MTELTEVSRTDSIYPYNANLTSLSGYRNVKVHEKVSFEQKISYLGKLVE